MASPLPGPGSRLSCSTTDARRRKNAPENGLERVERSVVRPRLVFGVAPIAATGCSDGYGKEPTVAGDKKADLAGPGISTYEEVEKILPSGYKSILGPRDTMKALYAVKNYIEENLCKELNLTMVQVPLIVDKDSGVNDYLDRDGSRTPIDFPCGLGLEKRIQAQVVQAATKWKRMALKTFECKPGEGNFTDPDRDRGMCRCPGTGVQLLGHVPDAGHIQPQGHG